MQSLLKSFLVKSFKSEKKVTVKIISISRKTEAKLQQTVLLRSSSSTVAFTGKSDFQDSSFKI